MSHNPFAIDAAGYARSRPQYPTALIDWIVAQCAATHAAWDCATGNGQAAHALAAHFDQVQATDLSPEQVGQIPPAANLHTSARSAEASGFPDAAFDLVTVAQALHWFDLDLFWPEVQRVSRPGALFCAWGYGWITAEPTVETTLLAPTRAVLAPHWAPQNGILLRGYDPQEIRFPFDELAVPPFEIAVAWTLEQLIAYLGTWSASKRARTDPALAAQLDGIAAGARACMDPHTPLRLRFVLKVRAGRVHAP